MRPSLGCDHETTAASRPARARRRPGGGGIAGDAVAAARGPAVVRLHDQRRRRPAAAAGSARRAISAGRARRRDASGCAGRADRSALAIQPAADRGRSLCAALAAADRHRLPDLASRRCGAAVARDFHPAAGATTRPPRAGVCRAGTARRSPHLDGADRGAGEPAAGGRRRPADRRAGSGSLATGGGRRRAACPQAPVPAGLPGGAPRRPALAVVVSALASPHALPHDLLILVVPAWLAVVLFVEGHLPNPIPGLLLVDLALVIDLRGTNLPLAPIVITAVLAWYGWQFRRRARQPHRPPVAAAA